MKIATISKEGLWVMGILVAVLWGYIAADRLVLRRANLEVIRTMQELKYLQIQNRRYLPSGVPRLPVEKSSSVTRVRG